MDLVLKLCSPLWRYFAATLSRQAASGKAFEWSQNTDGALSWQEGHQDAKMIASTGMILLTIEENSDDWSECVESVSSTLREYQNVKPKLRST